MNHKKIVKLRRVFKRLNGEDRLGIFSKVGWRKVKKEYNRLERPERKQI